MKKIQGKPLKHYVSKTGEYIGSFSGAVAPEKSIEVSKPPQDARQKWDGKKWIELSLSVTDYKELREIEYSKKEKLGELPSTLNDHLDEIYKGFEAILNGDDLPDNLVKIIEKRINIKTTIPKKQR